MAVLVDPLREYPDTGLPFRHWSHLVSDTSFEELHAFAARLGIPRRFFQGDHYDLPPHLRGPRARAGRGAGRHAGADRADGRPARGSRAAAAAGAGIADCTPVIPARPQLT